MPNKPIQWEVYRPIKGSPGTFSGIVEAPDETSARLFVRRVPNDED
jgi:hypothetical protein